MNWGIGHTIVASLTILGVVAMLTGNDGALMRNIIWYIFGVGTGGATAMLERKVKEK